MQGALVVLLVATATWGGWRWYLERVWVEPEEATALAVTVVVLAAAGFWGFSRFVAATIGLPPNPISGRQRASSFKSKPRDLDRTG